eukprot:5830142-Pyramimonas_sp.AAC.1
MLYPWLGFHKRSRIGAARRGHALSRPDMLKFLGGGVCKTSMGGRFGNGITEPAIEQWSPMM